MFLNETMQAVVILACEKHSPQILEKINQGIAGNWFALPTASVFRSGYWPNVSQSHANKGTAIVGFVESQELAQQLKQFESANLDNGICPDCAIYEWNISSLHAARMTRDPVCHRLVSCHNSLSFNYHNRLFFFCSIGCRDRFHRAPQQFVPEAPEPDFSTLETVER